MAFTTAVTLHASGAESTSSQGAAVDLAQKTAVELVLNISARSGTAPTLDLVIETSKDGVSGWRNAGNFDRITDEPENDEPVLLVVEGCDRFVRAKWTLEGTLPSFTFSLTGDAVVVYATPKQFEKYGLPAKVLEDLEDPSTHEQRKAATGRIDRALLAAGYTLPLLKWGDDITRDCCVLAAFDVLVTVGQDPDSSADTLLKVRYVELVGEPGRKGELAMIAEGKLVPGGIEDSSGEDPDTPATGAARAAVVSQPSRGWSNR